MLHANRALCQLRAGAAAAALHDAEAATEAAPLWPKAWVRVRVRMRVRVRVIWVSLVLGVSVSFQVRVKVGP